MAMMLWSQDNFSKGELSPLLYARTSIDAYYKGLKVASNVFSIPQGGATKRFGTKFLTEITNVDSYLTSKMVKWNYDDKATYICIFRANTSSAANTDIDIYLEGVLQDTVTITGIPESEINNLSIATVQNKIIIASRVLRPQVLELGTPTAENITAYNAAGRDGLTVSGTHAVGEIIPVTFSGTTLPTTEPQIVENITYYMYFFASGPSIGNIYETEEDAIKYGPLGTHYWPATSAGTSAQINADIAFTVGNLDISDYPNYNFGDQDYESISFQVSATSGIGITITATSAIFVDENINGIYSADEGLALITAVGSTTPVTTCTANVIKPFNNATTDIKGQYCFLTKQAWSDYDDYSRGWPRVVGSYQNRLVFANTPALPNGIWLSATNDFTDFGNVDILDDDPIAYFPSSSNVSFINKIVPYRSLTFHTNTGIYSTPLMQDLAITPTNFSLTLQDTTPSSKVDPVLVDNQIILASSNDVHSLVWDGANNAYSNTLVSVMSQHLINNPVDMTGYNDVINEGSRYVFITNEDGTMAMYQSLLSEEVSGWTKATFEQPYGNAYARFVESNYDGRCWIMMERWLAGIGSTANITGYSVGSNTLTASSLSMTAGDIIAVTFGGTTLPLTVPQVQSSTYYYINAQNATEFKIYATAAQAASDDSAFEISDGGTSATVTLFELTQKFFLEEIDFDSYVDCAEITYDASSTTVGSLSRFNGQSVLAQGDGFGFSGTVISDTFTFNAHGDDITVDDSQIGFPINVEITPMPISMSTGQNINTGNIVEPKHIRNVTFIFNNIVGGSVNSVPIAINDFNQSGIGSAPVPASGMFSMTPMKGWNNYKTPTFTITHSEPFDIKLLGVFYKVEI